MGRSSLPRKRKRRDQFPSLAASHAPSSSVRRTRRGARLATTPFRGREWPVNCGIPARHHHPRGTSGPCAWTFRIGPQLRLPVASSPREEVRCCVEDDFVAALQRPISGFRHREKPYGPSLHPAPAWAVAELREENLLLPHAPRQARESPGFGESPG